MLCIRPLVFLALAVSTSFAAQQPGSNLPLGLPADVILPLNLDGYRLVELDRKKEVVLVVDGKPVAAELPIFLYLPEKDRVAERIDALKAIRSELGRLASQRDSIEPTRLLTLVLALDRILGDDNPVTTRTSSSIQPATVQPTAPSPPRAGLQEAGTRLEQAIKGNQ